MGFTDHIINQIQVGSSGSRIIAPTSSKMSSRGLEHKLDDSRGRPRYPIVEDPALIRGYCQEIAEVLDFWYPEGYIMFGSGTSGAMMLVMTEQYATRCKGLYLVGRGQSPHRRGVSGTGFLREVKGFATVFLDDLISSKKTLNECLMDLRKHDILGGTSFDFTCLATLYNAQAHNLRPRYDIIHQTMWPM